MKGSQMVELEKDFLVLNSLSKETRGEIANEILKILLKHCCLTSQMVGMLDSIKDFILNFNHKNNK